MTKFNSLPGQHTHTKKSDEQLSNNNKYMSDGRITQLDSIRYYHDCYVGG